MSTVYIAKNAAGELLYVGCTDNLKERLAAHSGRSTWWADYATLAQEHYDDRPTALAREWDLIHRLRPLHNREPNRRHDDHQDQIDQLRETGMTWPDIAKQVGRTGRNSAKAMADAHHHRQRQQAARTALLDPLNLTDP